jgi:hypothetical protein
MRFTNEAHAHHTFLALHQLALRRICNSVFAVKMTCLQGIAQEITYLKHNIWNSCSKLHTAQLGSGNSPMNFNREDISNYSSYSGSSQSCNIHPYNSQIECEDSDQIGVCIWNLFSELNCDHWESAERISSKKRLSSQPGRLELEDIKGEFVPLVWNLWDNGWYPLVNVYLRNYGKNHHAWLLMGKIPYVYGHFQ